MNPAVAVLLGAAAGEAVGLRSIAALAFILAGVAIVATGRKSAPALAVARAPAAETRAGHA